MSLLTKKKFSFISHAVDKDTFTVVSFKGFEALSKPYTFEIILVSDKTDIDPLKVLQNPAKFTIHRDEEEDVDFNGILMQFEETREFDGFLFFKAVLSPKFQWLSLTHHNQVFLDATVPDIMESALKDGGLVTGIDFEFRLQKNYKALEYVCQYDESHFDFVSRWAEREGIYYFFEQTPNGEKIVFTDTKISHVDLLLGKDLVYVPQSGLDADHTKEVVKSFVCKHNMLPQRIYLKNYNYLKPSQAIEGIADVDENGRGENYIYGVNFDTAEDGKRLAQIRAEAMLCRKSTFHGESSVPYIVPGFTFDLNDHYKAAYNTKYLAGDITHEGHQAGYLVSGLSAAVEKRNEQMFYANSFSAIYADAQFRAEHLTRKPKISGTINAKIDAEGSGEYAELDDQGRYKVRLPFDINDAHKDGKASTYIRMMQPYANQKGGMQFPLTKGTEVLLSFIDGDPDRPIIAGAIPNIETQSPVSSKNQTESVIQTGGNNRIRMEDMAGKERIIMESPTASSWIRIGAPNDPILVSGANPYKINIDDSFTDPGAMHNGVTLTGSPATIDTSVAGTHTITYSVTHDGKTETAARTVVVGTFDDESEDVDSSADGVRYHTKGNMWTEAHDRYCNYIIGLPTNTGTPEPVRYLAQKFGSDFNPTGMKAYDYGANGAIPGLAYKKGTENRPITFRELVEFGMVTINKGDEFSTNEGNHYDFGGHWDYNFGNGYTETFIKQAGIEINSSDHKFDRATPGGPMPTSIKCNDISSEGEGSYVGLPNMSSHPFDNPAKAIKAGVDSFKSHVFAPAAGWGADTGSTGMGLDAAKTVIEKAIGGCKYEYNKKTKTLGVDYNCEEEKHTYGAAGYEYTYTGTGNLVSREISKAGNKEEWKYDRVSGAMLGYESTNWLGAGGVTLSLAFSMGVTNKIETSIAASHSLGLFLGEKTNIEISAAIKADISLSAALFFKLEAGMGIGMAIEGKPMTLSYNNSSGKFGWHGPGTRLDKEAAFNAKIQEVIIAKQTTELKKNTFLFRNGNFDLKNCDIFLSNSKMSFH